MAGHERKDRGYSRAAAVCDPAMLEAYRVSNLLNNQRFDSPAYIAGV